MLTSPAHPTASRLAAPRRPVAPSRPPVIALADVRRRRRAPIVRLGIRHFRVVNPRLQYVASWVARAGWEDWVDWFYEPEG